MDKYDIRTTRGEEIVDITARVREAVRTAGAADGLAVIFVPHTTAGVTINENADPDVKADLLMTLRKVVPDALPYAHGEGNSPAHVKASLVGSSVTVIIEGGQLRLGTWQGVCLCEFDGPRTRQVWIKVVA
ncbi:MAG: secondary thiamine-phosphate synthase enzyme YjbQ [Candidatus Aminicenantes bacterium]|nr:secondary thiamine-phosphate synthase enzyme YjbQ [Candidatus Aminicenantes bacterium]